MAKNHMVNTKGAVKRIQGILAAKKAKAGILTHTACREEEVGYEDVPPGCKEGSPALSGSLAKSRL